VNRTVVNRRAENDIDTLSQAKFVMDSIVREKRWQRLEPSFSSIATCLQRHQPSARLRANLFWFGRGLGVIHRRTLKALRIMALKFPRPAKYLYLSRTVVMPANNPGSCHEGHSSRPADHSREYSLSTHTEVIMIAQLTCDTSISKVIFWA
jgi:hypothetical protein